MDKFLAVMVSLIGYLIFLGVLFYESADQPKPCPMEALLCVDGSQVTRQFPSCEFPECPQPVICDALKPCAIGDCIRFEHVKYSICHTGDPCQQCPTQRCQVLDSYPLQVKCQN